MLRVTVLSGILLLLMRFLNVRIGWTLVTVEVSGRRGRYLTLAGVG